MRILFLGDGKIGEQCLLLLLQRFRDSHALVGLVTSAGLLHNHQVQSLRSRLVGEMVIDPALRQEGQLIDLIQASKPDVLISVQYPWILSSEVIKQIGGRIANLHNAKLPDYRGHHAISHEIINSETHHVSTLHWIAEDVDRGLEIATESIPILPQDTAYTLWQRSVHLCVKLLEFFLEATKRRIPKVTGRLIPDGGRYYARKDIQSYKHIPEWAAPDAIDRIARAFWFPPHEPAFLQIQGRKLYVLPYSYRYEVDSGK